MSRVEPSTADIRSGGTVFEGDHPWCDSSTHICSSENPSQHHLCREKYATVAKLLTVAGLKTDTLPDAKASAASLCFSNNFLDPILSLGNIRALSNSATTTHAQI